MTEPITARPEIDPTLKALVDAIPMTFKASDGVEAARAKLKQLQAPPEMLPDLRIENRIVGHGDVTDIPVRIYWPSAEPGNLPIVVFYPGGGFAVGEDGVVFDAGSGWDVLCGLHVNPLFICK